MALSVIALLTISLLAAVPHCDGTLPAPTRHQAQAEDIAERYLTTNHAALAHDTFRHARRQTDLPAPAWEQVQQAMLDNPERAHCVAPGHWPEQGVVCYQSYRAYEPVDAFIQASIYVEMRNIATEGDKASPEVVSAHVRAQGMYVRYEEPEPG